MLKDETEKCVELKNKIFKLLDEESLLISNITLTLCLTLFMAERIMKYEIEHTPEQYLDLKLDAIRMAVKSMISGDMSGLRTTTSLH